MYYLVDSFLAPKKPKSLIHLWLLAYIIFWHYRSKASRSGTHLIKKLFTLIDSSFLQLQMVLNWYIGMASLAIVAKMGVDYTAESEDDTRMHTLITTQPSCARTMALQTVIIHIIRHLRFL